MFRNIPIEARHVIKPYVILFGTFLINFAGMMWCYPANLDVYHKFKGALMNDFWLEEYQNGPIFVATEIVSKFAYFKKMLSNF